MAPERRARGCLRALAALSPTLFRSHSHAARGAGMADVFVSYKREDVATARTVVTRLRAEGRSVGWDDGLSPHEAWDTAIEREIAAARVVPSGAAPRTCGVRPGPSGAPPAGRRLGGRAGGPDPLLARARPRPGLLHRYRPTPDLRDAGAGAARERRAYRHRCDRPPPGPAGGRGSRRARRTGARRAGRVRSGGPDTAFRLVGSLAEGADMIVADAALARGWRVDAVLPFARGGRCPPTSSMPARRRSWTATSARSRAASNCPGDGTSRAGPPRPMNARAGS